MSKNKKKAIGLILVIVLVCIGGMKVGSYLPTIGDHNTPANGDVSVYYIENAYHDTHAPNIVTAVLADYRGFDTLFETCVLFLSGVVTLMVLPSIKKDLDEAGAEKEKEKKKAKSSFGGIVLDSSFRFILPVIMIYGIYVLFHGEISLGGGFQAGALLACVYLIDRLVPSFSSRMKRLKPAKTLIIAGCGTFLYAFTGILTMLGGGKFLEYNTLPVNWLPWAEHISLHSVGILMIEAGVTICVMMVIINILEVVLERTDFDE